jgi:hypothetical protein
VNNDPHLNGEQNAHDPEPDRDTETTDDAEQREIERWAKRVVDALPPLTEEQRERLALLLRTRR